ncbi:MAG TPA: glucosaminidase domain-containing protein [Candidatus Onthocola stercorigallinarum]|nr:glucosaminidase domain-containing protein [Candidatus Onthocola stercorigallinarum]
MKEYIKKNKKGLILLSIGAILLTFSLTMHHYINRDEMIVHSISYNVDAEVPETSRILSEEEILNIFLTNNTDIIKFMSDIFQVDHEVLLNKLREDYQSINLLDTDDLDRTLLDYLIALEDSNPEMFSNTLNTSDPSKEYMVALIKYFCDYYGNVDFSIAAAIAEIESGYSAKSMLNKNNIFGGMSSGGLIKYKNIEYGIYSYIKLLSEGYFGKGLTTVEAIGRVYNPTYNEAGVKIAKPSWVANVSNAMSDYSVMDTVEIEALLSLKEA